MGEVAEAMLDGTLCDDDVAPKVSKKVPFPVCGKKVKPAGLADHQRDKHGSLK
jgi:hypothetical protein